MTSPIRAAAAAAHDPQRLSLWAGTGYRLARAALAATIVAHLGSV
jgi:nitronate monooxygenase